MKRPVDSCGTPVKFNAIESWRPSESFDCVEYSRTVVFLLLWFWRRWLCLFLSKEEESFFTHCVDSRSEDSFKWYLQRERLVPFALIFKARAYQQRIPVTRVPRNEKPGDSLLILLKSVYDKGRW